VITVANDPEHDRLRLMMLIAKRFGTDMKLVRVPAFEGMWVKMNVSVGCMWGGQSPV
jgi:hypothetical protein